MDLRRLLTLAFIAAALPLGAQSPLSAKKDFVLTEKEALGVLPAQPICGSRASRARWSSDGKYLFVVQEEANITSAVVKTLLTNPESLKGFEPLCAIQLYNDSNAKTSTVWKGSYAKLMIRSFEWLPGTHTALLQTMESGKNERGEEGLVNVISLLNADTERLVTLAKSAIDVDFECSISPTKPLFAIRATHDRSYRPNNDSGRILQAEATLSVYDAAGRVITQGKSTLGGFPTFLSWTEDGTAPITAFHSFDSDEGKPIVKWYAISQQKLTEVPPPAVPGNRKAETAKAPLMAVPVRQELKLETKIAETRALWLRGSFESEFKSVLLCGDVQQAELSPAGNAVFYVSQGVAFVRQIVPFPKEMFLAQLAAEERMEALTKVKQIGTALQMYAADNKDELPMKEMDLLGLLHPYMKNGEMLKGFIYTFEGGSLAAESSPASLELGYIPVSGGRAVVYADGHAKFVPDK